MKAFLFLICFFLFRMHRDTKAHKERKTRQVYRANQDGNCIVRDGRDGVHGPPGPQGPQGIPGRDGRDCFGSVSFMRLIRLEKRIEELSATYQLANLESKKILTDLRTYRNKTRRLYQLLIAKGILDKDISNVHLTTITSGGAQGNNKSDQTKTVNTTTKRLGKSSVWKKVVGKNAQYFTVTTHVRTPTAQSTPESATRSADPIPSVDAKPKTKFCATRFHVHQEILTNGAVNMDIFEVDNQTYLAVANFHYYKRGYDTDSFIYRMNTSGFFEMFQKLTTSGCRALVAFARNGDQYLLAANHYDGSNHALSSVIYKWNGTRFQDHEHIQTYGASSAQLFSIDGIDYLVVANYRNKTTVSIPSVVYRWRNDKLVVFQEIPTHGAVDAKFLQTTTGDRFLVFANYYTPEKEYDVESTIFKWDGQKFVFLQSIQASAAMGVDMFEGGGFVFLAVASQRMRHSWHSHSMVYKWNGASFVVFQKIPTTAAVKVHHFYDTVGSLYLTIANYFDEVTDYDAHSMVYKYNGKHFRKFQGILTTGSYDLQPFVYKGVPYLASAFRFNGKNSTLHSRIYKMSGSCEHDRYPQP